MILKALRESEAPLSTSQIVTAIFGAGGHGETAKPTMAPRVRGNLAYLEKRRMVLKSSNDKGARWELASRQ